MVQTKNIHIIELTKNLISRVKLIKNTPHSILTLGVEEMLVREAFPSVRFVKDVRVDLILAIVEFSEQTELVKLFEDWRRLMCPSGVLIFSILDAEFDVQVLGDLMVQLGFSDVVIDCEDAVIYGHALRCKETSIKINQVRRAT